MFGPVVKFSRSGRSRRRPPSRGLSPEQKRLLQKLIRSQKAAVNLRMRALAYEADKKLD